MRLGYQAITWGGVVGDPTGVTSVKDLYYRANGSMDRAIADIGAAGFEGIEMFDGNVVDFADRAGELRTLLDRAGVELVSVYTGGNFIYEEILLDELDRVTRAAALAETFGATNLVVGGGARRAAGTRGTDYERLAATLDQITQLAESYGLVASYHPAPTTWTWTWSISARRTRPTPSWHHSH
jgi:inosose dehydratase